MKFDYFGFDCFASSVVSSFCRRSGEEPVCSLPPSPVELERSGTYRGALSITFFGVGKAPRLGVGGLSFIFDLLRESERNRFRCAIYGWRSKIEPPFGYTACELVHTHNHLLSGVVRKTGRHPKLQISGVQKLTLLDEICLGSLIRAVRAHVDKKGAENRRLLDSQCCRLSGLHGRERIAVAVL